MAASVKDRWTMPGKKVVVTGGTKGIGEAIVQECLELGATVYFIARSEETVKEKEKAWKEEFGEERVFGFVGDVSDKETAEKFAGAVKDKFGTLDALINNVGTNIRKKAETYTDDEFDFIMKVNLESCFRFCRLFFPLLKEGKSNNGPYSSIVNISSVAGLFHIKSGIVYGMTKAAMNQLTKNLACEWAQHGILVNSICPWYINTPLVEPVLGKPEYLAEVVSRTPIQRVGQPREVSGMVAFLLLPAAQGFLTGQCLAIDGGFVNYGF